MPYSFHFLMMDLTEPRGMFNDMEMFLYPAHCIQCARTLFKNTDIKSNLKKLHLENNLLFSNEEVIKLGKNMTW